MAIYPNEEKQIYRKLGVRPLINAAGNQTIHGGSTPTPSVKQAMEAVEDTWVEIQDLIDASGARIARLLGVEAAYVTAGMLRRAGPQHGRLHFRERRRETGAIARYGGDEERDSSAKGATLRVR